MQLLDSKQAKPYAGYIGVEVETKQKADGRWYPATDIRYTELARVSRPLLLDPQDPRPLFHLFNMGGGFMGGESYRCDLIVRDNTTAIFTSQSASKIFKVQKPGEAAKNFINLEVGANSVVEYINDSVILYPTAEYQQMNEFHLRDSSTFFYSEIFSPGYSSDGQKYQYTQMWLNTKIYVEDKILLFDNLIFEPQKEYPAIFGVMDGFDRCGSAFFIGQQINEHLAEELRSLVHEEFSDIHHELGISCFAEHAIGVRVLANEVYEIEKITMRIHNYLRQKLLHLAPLDLRKSH